MKNKITIPSNIAGTIQQHLFQNHLEQGAFLFANPKRKRGGLTLVVTDCYLVPASGWDVQADIYLEMKDSERAKIMNLAREKHLCAIDCHSHPHADEDVWFSPSDIAGITEFAQYAKWKLGGKPFAAMVWGKHSVDVVLWQDEFSEAQRLASVIIVGKSKKGLIPTGSWFRKPKGKHKFASYE